jgi:hypothetical protein
VGVHGTERWPRGPWDDHKHDHDYDHPDDHDHSDHDDVDHIGDDEHQPQELQEAQEAPREEELRSARAGGRTGPPARTSVLF